MKNVFILEDSKDRIKWFKDNWYHVNLDIAEDIEQVETVFKGPYDLLCLDHDLGDRIFVSTKDFNTGTAFCTWLVKRKNENHNIPILIHSHNPMGAEKMESILIEAGFFDVKKLSFATLIKVWAQGILSICGKYKFDDPVV